MWLMLQQEQAEDYVIATGATQTVRKLCEVAFEEAGVLIEWSGSGGDEVGVVKEITGDLASRILNKGDVVIKIDPRFYRPAEVDLLIGDPAKAKKNLGWEPEVDFKSLTKMMVQSDLENVKKLL